FSSRRRHTRLVSDWSSDVCSSDLSACCSLAMVPPAPVLLQYFPNCRQGCTIANEQQADVVSSDHGRLQELTECLSEHSSAVPIRSEERRVGKEGRTRGASEHGKKK